jgi:hypothetical protein
MMPTIIYTARTRALLAIEPRSKGRTNTYERLHHGVVGKLWLANIGLFWCLFRHDLR